MSITRFPHGVSSFGIPIIGAGPIVTTGNVFFVDDSGSNNNSGRDPGQPFATLTYAITQCTASQGDTIILMPGHAETTTAIALSKAGIHVVGLGIGADRPTLTATTGTSDLINVTGAKCCLENFNLVGAASGCTALVDVAADDVKFINMNFSHGATPLNAVTVSSGARVGFYSCKWNGTANGPDIGICFENAAENACKDFEVLDCIFNYGLFGLDLAAITNESTGTVEGGVINNCIFSGMLATAIDFNSSSAAAVRGIISNCVGTAFTGVTIAEFYDLSSYGAVNLRAVDAVDNASPDHIPATTSS